MTKSVELIVSASDPATNSRFAGELAEAIRATHPDVEIEIRKDNSETMDLGATLALIAGTAAATAVAKGVAAWLEKRQSATVTVRRNGTIVAKNVTSADALRVISAAISRE